MKSPRPRPYHMNARADAAAETGRRIIAAATTLVDERFYDDVSLADIASAAGVTVQTVLRRFGSKEGLLDAALQAGSAEVRNARWAAAPGDLEAALTGLMAHYELWGDRSLRYLAQELTTPPMRRVTDAGRALHRAWVDHAFGPWLAAAGERRAELFAMLVAATDVYVWKVFRRDLALDVADATAALRSLLTAILATAAAGR